MTAPMRSDLFERGDAVRQTFSTLCAKTAEMIARSNEDRQLRGALADSIRFAKQVERLIVESIDELDVDDAASLLSESRDLKAGIASLRDSLTRGPWVFQ